MVYSYNRVLFDQKRNDVPIHVKTWMNLENIIYMKEARQKETDNVIPHPEQVNP